MSLGSSEIYPFLNGDKKVDFKYKEGEIENLFKDFLIGESFDRNENVIEEENSEAEFSYGNKVQDFRNIEEQEKEIEIPSIDNFYFHDTLINKKHQREEKKQKDSNEKKELQMLEDILNCPSKLPIVYYEKKCPPSKINPSLLEKPSTIPHSPSKKTHTPIKNKSKKNVGSELFKTVVYDYQDGIIRQRKKRKYKPDDIRKKIKSRFHKSIKNIINEGLRKNGSIKLFDFLPQIFISSISREKNQPFLDLTYKEIIARDFVSDIDEKKYKNKSVDIAKYKHNLDVLNYLEKNPELSEKSGFNLLGNMKYSELLNCYFVSKEFEKSIDKLKKEKENDDYIEEYISKANNYVDFFSKQVVLNDKNKKQKNDKDSSESRSGNSSDSVSEYINGSVNSIDKESQNLNACARFNITGRSNGKSDVNEENITESNNLLNIDEDKEN